MHSPVHHVLGGILIALVLASAVRLTHLRRRSDSEAVRLRKSLATWWCLAVLMAIAVLSGNTGIVILMCIASLLGMREIINLMPARHADRGRVHIVHVAIILNYVWIYLGWHSLFVAFLPILTLLFVCTAGVIKADTDGFIRAVSSLYLGLMLTGYAIAHAAALTMLPEELNSKAGTIGWVLFLILLTATNDISQSLWGKRIGRHRIVPKVSPNKTWEGMLAGVATTVLLSLLVGSALTPLVASSPQPGIRYLGQVPYLAGAIAGLLIGVGGFFGDVTMSAVKRDLGVKDSGTMLPGQGGILDRIDSLTFSAPLFYWYIRAICGS